MRYRQQNCKKISMIKILKSRDPRIDTSRNSLTKLRQGLSRPYTSSFAIKSL